MITENKSLILPEFRALHRDLGEDKLNPSKLLCLLLHEENVGRIVDYETISEHMGYSGRMTRSCVLSIRVLKNALNRQLEERPVRVYTILSSGLIVLPKDLQYFKIPETEFRFPVRFPQGDEFKRLYQDLRQTYYNFSEGYVARRLLTEDNVKTLDYFSNNHGVILSHEELWIGLNPDNYSSGEPVSQKVIGSRIRDAKQTLVSNSRRAGINCMICTYPGIGYRFDGLSLAGHSAL